MTTEKDAPMKRIAALCLVLMLVSLAPAWAEEARVAFVHDPASGRMTVTVDGKDAFVYRHGDDVDLPHYCPLNGPSGKNMLLDQVFPYKDHPHHRSFWFADRVSFEGGEPVTLYNAIYSGAGGGDDPPAPWTPPYRDRIRHVAFTGERVSGDTGTVTAALVWLTDYDKPLLDEHRILRVRALGDGEYFLDVTFALTASYGDVAFVSDAVHYAWPYIRVNEDYSVLGGTGKIVNSEGGVNEAETHDREAVWIDYSGGADGATEGVAIFSHPSNGHPHKWLVRDYGCFGPRRPDAQSGVPFTIKRGDSIAQRVGVLVHRGDAEGGKVAERHAQYTAGEW
jgi:hypothetical protein